MGESSWWDRAVAFVAPWGGAETSDRDSAAGAAPDSPLAVASEEERDSEADGSPPFANSEGPWALYAPFAVLVGAAAGYILTLHWQARAKMREARAKTCTGPCCSEAPSDLLAIRSSLRATHALSCAHLSASSLSSVDEARSSDGRSRRPGRRPKSSSSQAAYPSSDVFESTSPSSARKHLPSGSARKARKGPRGLPAEYVTPSRRIYETLWGGEEDTPGEGRQDGERRLGGEAAWNWVDDEATFSGRRRGRHERRIRDSDTARWPISY